MSSSSPGIVLVPPAIGIPGNTKEAAAERLKEFLRGVHSDTSIPHTHSGRVTPYAYYMQEGSATRGQNHGRILSDVT